MTDDIPDTQADIVAIYRRMVSQYVSLIRARETDPAKWHKVHALSPVLAHTALLDAMRQCSQRTVADMLLRLTASQSVMVTVQNTI